MIKKYIYPPTILLLAAISLLLCEASSKAAYNLPESLPHLKWHKVPMSNKLDLQEYDFFNVEGSTATGDLVATVFNYESFSSTIYFLDHAHQEQGWQKNQKISLPIQQFVINPIFDSVFAHSAFVTLAPNIMERYQNSKLPATGTTLVFGNSIFHAVPVTGEEEFVPVGSDGFNVYNVDRTQIPCSDLLANQYPSLFACDFTVAENDNFFVAISYEDGISFITPKNQTDLFVADKINHSTRWGMCFLTCYDNQFIAIDYRGRVYQASVVMEPTKAVSAYSSEE